MSNPPKLRIIAISIKLIFSKYSRRKGENFIIFFFRCPRKNNYAVSTDREDTYLHGVSSSPQAAAAAAVAKSLQSCPTLCDPIDSSPPGFPVPRILQARTLEWVAILRLVIPNSNFIWRSHTDIKIYSVYWHPVPSQTCQVRISGSWGQSTMLSTSNMLYHLVLSKF